MMKTLSLMCFVALLCVGNSNLAFGQNPVLSDPTDAASARQLLADAIILCDSGQYQLAEKNAERAYRFFRQSSDSQPSDLAEAAYQTGRCFFGQSQNSVAQGYFEEASKIWATFYPQGSQRTADALHFVSRCLFREDKTDQALIVCTQAYEIRKKLQPSNPCGLSESLRLIGHINLELGRYQKAIEHLESALPIQKICAGEESAGLANILRNLGTAYLRSGDYQKSIAIQEQALVIRQKVLPPFHADIGSSYYELGSVYKALLKFNDALFYFEKALEIQRKNAKEENMMVAATYSEIGQCYVSQRDFSKALTYFEKENDIMMRSKVTDDMVYVYLCADMAQTQSALKNYPAAIEWNDKMVAIWRKFHKNIDSQLASLLTRQALARLSNGDFEIACGQYQEAKQIWEALYGKENPAASLADGGLANTYRKWYQKTGQDSLLVKARKHYRLFEAGVEKKLLTETSADAQKKKLAESLPIFSKAIDTELIFLKKHPGDSAALENAWQLSEAMHGYLLLLSTQEANARHFAGIPDLELSRDSLLRVQTTALEKKRRSLIESQGLSLTDSLVLALSVQISAKKGEARQLQAFLEKSYPDYFRLKYQLETSSLKKTQELLSPQQTLLEYFTGDSSIFVFLVQPEGSRMIELPLDFPLNSWVQSFCEGISGYHTSTQKTPALYQKTVLQYADAAQKLYEKLLAPIAKSLTSEIIVVPGDGFANLPFEALLSAAPKDLSSFNTYPFLLRSHSFQYAYSATMLHQMIARQHHQIPAGGLLAFAPFFEEDTVGLVLRLKQDEAVRLGLSALPFSGEEVFRAKKRYAGNSEVLTGKAGTKQKFLELAAHYKILHLATHGKANYLAGDFSFLAFAGDDGTPENRLLSVGELYNLSLNADLVLLSACETGIGEQQRGEGVVSLARAFAFAGAKSIVASLWSVNDKSTMLVMDNFYAGLKMGKPKNVALANAKLRYLEKNPGQPSHPFFWAGFVGVGDMGAIKN
ncbi:MAG: CHAT domain-containing protein [Phycisphaerae bacterium]|nr:CHAT domain-containing protein [Saprospiraceae bacterium]